MTAMKKLTFSRVRMTLADCHDCVIESRRVET